MRTGPAPARVAAAIALANAQVVAAGAAYVAAVTALDLGGTAALTLLAVPQVVVSGDPNSPLKFQDGIEQLTKNTAEAAKVVPKLAEAVSAVQAAFASI